MQHSGKPLIVRAYELAKSGKFSTNKVLRQRLKREGYTLREIEAEFSGAALRAKLAELMSDHPDQRGLIKKSRDG